MGTIEVFKFKIVSYPSYRIPSFNMLMGSSTLPFYGINLLMTLLYAVPISACGTFCSLCTDGNTCTDCVEGYYVDTNNDCVGKLIPAKRIILIMKNMKLFALR